MVVMARVIRATLPYVVQLAKWWEHITAGWRKSSRDQNKLDKFFATAVKNFKLWAKFGDSVWRVLKTILAVSQGEGQQVLTIMTNLVNKFADWLQSMRDTGKIDNFWRIWNRSVSIAFWAFQHPAQAFNRFFPQVLNLLDQWLPVIMNHIASAFVNNAGRIASTFISAWVNAGAWAKLLTAAVILRKFGFFGWLGRRVGTMFVEPFIAKFASAFLASIGIELGAGSAIEGAMKTAGGTMGKAFGLAFRIAAFASMIYAVTIFQGWLKKQPWYQKLTGTGKGSIDKKVGGGGQVSNFLHSFPFGNALDAVKSFWGATTNLFNVITGSVKDPTKFNPPGGQFGGVIGPGGMSIVGEAGPELAIAGVRGTEIRPLSSNSRHTLPSIGIPSLPDLSDKLHFTIHNYMVVDSREVARSVANYSAYEAARRGGRAQPSRGFDTP
jgi:hypothetical protein